MKKLMSAAEFRRLGYLQELNRRHLHPLGLALEVVRDGTTGDERFGAIWDCRDDPEGIYFDPSQPLDAEAADRVTREWMSRREPRVLALGYVIQPVVPLLVGPDPGDA